MLLISNILGYFQRAIDIRQSLTGCYTLYILKIFFWIYSKSSIIYLPSSLFIFIHRPWFSILIFSVPKRGETPRKWRKIREKGSKALNWSILSSKKITSGGNVSWFSWLIYLSVIVWVWSDCCRVCLLQWGSSSTNGTSWRTLVANRLEKKWR